MTRPSEVSGPSLLQARTTTSRHGDVNRIHDVNHNHSHLHFHQHRRLHNHAHSRQPQGADATTSPYLRSSLPARGELLHAREEIVIVQTVSVVHYIDGSGAVTSTSTIRSDPDPATAVAPPPKPQLVDPADITAGLGSLLDALPSVPLSGLFPDLIDGAPSTTAPAQPEPTGSFPLFASSETLTSAPLTSPSAFPTLSTFNSSSQFPTLFNNGTAGLYANRTRTSLSSKPTFTSTITESSTSTRLTSTSAFENAVPSVWVDGAGGDGNPAAGIPAPPATDPETGPESGSGLPPETRNAVVGGVVGGIAGIALVALGLLFFLKWRRQRSRGIMLLGDGDSTVRGRGGLGGYGTSGGHGSSSGGPGGGGMTERSGAFAIPAALAKLSGVGSSSKRAIAAAESSPPQEKGFYRVSGRKLISVLESGGDGYSDPHDSVGSSGGALSSSYRDTYRDLRGFSRAFSDGDPLSDRHHNQPLRLGSPMRPVSGVMIMRDGPQRTPVEERGPLPPGHRPSAFPALLPVPGSARASSYSRGGSSRGSRFTEDAAA
ncbi:hypothetical protein VTK26DRAFT_6999 [Humicola hyalothermophila]